MAEEDFDSGFDLLPAEEGDISESEELAALLGADTEEDDEDAPPIPLGRGWAFDFESGQFERAGLAPRHVYGEENVKVWIEKTLRTARYAHPIYPDSYGTEMPQPLIGVPFTSDLAGKVGTAITDALLAHDRISKVEDLQFTGGVESDLLEIEYTVVLDEDEDDPDVDGIEVAGTITVEDI